MYITRSELPSDVLNSLLRYFGLYSTQTLALCGDPWALALALGGEHGGKLGSFKELLDYCLAMALETHRRARWWL